MSAINNKWSKWPQIVGIGLICSLAITGCNRSEKDDSAEVEVNVEQPVGDDNVVAPVINCDDPLVKDRLTTALKSALDKQVQSLAASYGSETQISLDSGSVSDRASSVLINVQNAAVLPDTDNSGMTTCQASVSMTVPSEDIYQANQVQAANNKPSLQTRLAQDNIRMSSNMLVDDAFTYVVGTQGGQVQARMVGQPAIIKIVADVVASSALQSIMDEQKAERQAAEAKRRRQQAQKNEQKQTSRPPQAITPLEPIRPVKPIEPPTPPKINQGDIQENSQDDSQGTDSAAITSNTNTINKDPTTPKAPVLVPNDENIDMIIVEDESATY